MTLFQRFLNVAMKTFFMNVFMTSSIICLSTDVSTRSGSVVRHQELITPSWIGLLDVCVHWNCSSPVKFCIIRLKPVPIYLLWRLFSSPITTNFLRICAHLNGVFKETIMYHFVLFFVNIFFFSLPVIKYTRFFVFDIIIDW